MADGNIEHLKKQQAELHHVSEHLANERTILAWVRTAIAIITLGIALNRFSLFLVEFSHIVPGGLVVSVELIALPSKPKMMSGCPSAAAVTAPVPS